MRRFKIITEGRSSPEPEIVEFQAQEVGTALELTARIVEASHAEMWCDDELLCKLSRAGDRNAPFWYVG
ncbi:MAG: hypothetical protein KKE77_12755 [Alphaproteobacteria bacterium]|nr:hypothetical protein [Alphaproteobacteria bacterium]